MPIQAKVGGQLVNIIEVITRQGGVLVRKCPLKAKINGILVDFITYGYAVTAIMNLTPDGFDSSTLSSTINGLGGSVGNVVVNFSGGTFLCNTSIAITVGNVTLKGTPSTVLKCNGTLGSHGIIDIRGGSGVELQNIVIDGITIDGDYTTTGHTSYGIYCYFVGRKSTKNTTQLFDINKVGVVSSSIGGITITNCTVRYNSSYGIITVMCSDSIISKNTIHNNNGASTYGIYLNTSNSITVMGNMIKNNGGCGIYVGSSSMGTIVGNVVQNNGNHGIYLGTSSNMNIVAGNTVQNNASNNGITIDTSNFNTVSGNTIQNNYYDGIRLSTSLYNTVTGNTISFNGSKGINLIGSSNNTFVSNSVQNNNNIGFSIDSTSSNNIVIANNTLSNLIANANSGTGSKLYSNMVNGLVSSI